jgi:hypothetical protein
MLSAVGQKLPKDSLSDEDVLMEVAQRLVQKRMSVPAIFLLELHKPLVPLFHAGGVAVEPLLSVVMGKFRSETLVRFFESRENVEMLIAKIEELERARGN